MVPVSRNLTAKLTVADWVAVDPMYLQGLTLSQIDRKIYKQFKLRVGRRSLVEILNFYKVQYKCNLTLKTLANKNAKY
jgi:hypothetical protein